MKATFQRMGVLFATVLGALVVLASIVWLVWRLALGVPPNAARAWALAATALLPLTAWVSWYFGHTEARGRLAGIDQAVDKVMGAATKTAGLRVGATRALRQAAKPEPSPTLPTVILPDVEIIPRRRLPPGRDIVEL